MSVQPRATRLIWIFLPVALVLGVVVAMWMRPAPLDTGGNALLENGMQIDASLSGLQDPQGRPVEEKQFAGRYRLVAFGFTSCPDICPTMLAGVHQALEQLGPQAAQVAPVFVSVDPDRDTPQRVGVYVASFDPRIAGLWGTPETLARIARNYKVHYEKKPLGAGKDAYTVDHTALIYLIDPKQKIRALIPTSAGPQQVASEIVDAFHAIQTRG